MIMALSIKDPETHKLAAALAKATGESMTRAVNLANRERLERIERKRRSCTSDLLAIGVACADGLKSGRLTMLVFFMTSRVCRSDGRQIGHPRRVVQTAS